MKKLFVIIISVLFFSSCATMSDISKLSPNSNISAIPTKSNKIMVTTDKSDIDNFNSCLKKLLEFEYEITTKDREAGYILAEKKSEFDTYVKLNISFSSGIINISPSWKAGTSSEILASAVSGLYGIKAGWEPARWYKNSSKPSVAFIEADKLAQSLSGKVSYQFPAKEPFNKNADAIYN
jgi:hypothetical protein